MRRRRSRGDRGAAEAFQRKFQAKAKLEQATKGINRRRGTKWSKRKAKCFVKGKSRDGDHGQHGEASDPKPMAGRRSLNNIKAWAGNSAWAERARSELKQKLLAASRESKRRKVCEIMDSCGIQFGNDGLSAGQVFTIAAVLGETNIRSADQYLAEVELLQLEQGITWSDVLDRQLTMVKRALKRDTGPEHRAKEVKPDSIRDVWERRNKEKGVPNRVAWCYAWANLWMLRCVELVNLKVEDVTLIYSHKWVGCSWSQTEAEVLWDGFLLQTVSVELGHEGASGPRVRAGESPVVLDGNGTGVPMVKVIKARMDAIDPEMTGHSGRRSGA